MVSGKLAVVLALLTLVAGAYINNAFFVAHDDDKAVSSKIDGLGDRMTRLEVSVAGMVAKLDTILERAPQWVTRVEHQALADRVKRLEDDRD